MGFLDDIGASVESAWRDVTSTGVPAVIAGVEAYAAEQLSQEAKKNQQSAQAAANQVLSNPNASAGVMGSINKTLGSVAQGAFLKQYGIYILAGALGLYIVIKKVG